MALEPPFASRGECYASVVSSVLHAPPVAAPPGYSAGLSGAVESLLARNPFDRPTNRAFLQSLQEATTSGQAQKAPSGPGLAAVPAAAGVAGACGGAGSTGGAVGAPTPVSHRSGPASH